MNAPSDTAPQERSSGVQAHLTQHSTASHAPPQGSGDRIKVSPGIGQRAGEGPHCPMPPSLYYCPNKVRWTTHHDVSGYDLRIHADGFNEKGLRRGPGWAGGKGPQTRSGLWA